MQFILVGLFAARALNAATDVYKLSNDPEATPRVMWANVGIGLINTALLYGVAFHY